LIDWHRIGSIGEGLQTQWRDMHSGLGERAESYVAELHRQVPMLGAISDRRNGCEGAIATLLRSDRNLSQMDREALAHFVEGGFGDPPRGPGAPSGATMRVAGHVAYFVDEWKEACWLHGIRTHGATEEMRVEATRFICAELGLTDEVQIETVLEYLRKGDVKLQRQKFPRNRR